MSEATGRAAELVARFWYEAHGFTMLGTRLRTASGEIDLVVADATMIVFVEVKARRSLIAGAESVSPRQQARIIAAAEILLADHQDWARSGTRFDVFLVASGSTLCVADAFRLA